MTVSQVLVTTVCIATVFIVAMLYEARRRHTLNRRGKSCTTDSRSF